MACSKASLDTTLRQLAGEYTVRHSGKPIDGSPLSVGLLFEDEKSARLALEILGGGVRGLYRVVMPAWLSKTNKQPASEKATFRFGGGGGSRPGGGYGGGFSGGEGVRADEERWAGLRNGSSGGGESNADAKPVAKDELWDDDDDDAGAAPAAPTASTAPATTVKSDPPPCPPSVLEEPDAWDDED